LAAALEAGTIAGAALDVFEGHPLPLSSPLMTRAMVPGRAASNLILTPHIGGATEETIERHSRMITEDIERFIAGEPLLHAVTGRYAGARGR
jgi:D-3-phosphoglycerate dehydrogenase